MGSELSPQKARLALGPLGRLMYDAKPRPLWERDTRTLPLPMQGLRRRYRRFARTHIAPFSLKADLNPKAVDVRALFLKSAKRGFQTELMPWPIGTMKWSALAISFLMGPALKAEEFCAACGGLGLSLLAHELGMAPLFLCGEVGVITR